MKRAASGGLGHYWTRPQSVLMCVSSRETPALQALQEAGATGLEPAASGVTGRRSNQLSYAPSTGA
jgi:hypothetical protein